MKTMYMIAMSVALAFGVAAAAAQQSSSSGPSQMPDEAQGHMSAPGVDANENSVAVPPEAPPLDLTTLSGDKYIYTTLRVVTKGNARGCAVSDWACMSRLCKQDLGANSWRGWAGCNPHNNDFVCYFECALVRDAF